MAKTPPIDFPAVRSELRNLSRGGLLIIVERAIELMPASQLNALLGDFVQLTERFPEEHNAAASLLDEVRAFYSEAMAGTYYETIAINIRGRQEQSSGTDAFISDFDRLLHACIRASDKAEDTVASVGFELLFGLLRHIDEGNDDVLFFADDSGSSPVGVNWPITMPVYLTSLARTTPPEEFAHAVDAAIEAFVPKDRQHYLTVVRKIAIDAQRLPLDAVATGKRILPGALAHLPWQKQASEKRRPAADRYRYTKSKAPSNSWPQHTNGSSPHAFVATHSAGNRIRQSSASKKRWVKSKP